MHQPLSPQPIAAGAPPAGARPAAAAAGARALADARKDARERRVRMIRRRVAGGTLVLFTAVWLLIGFRLATGHDPKLSAKATSASTAATTTSTASTASTDSTEGSDDGSVAALSTASVPSPVVTSQS